MSEFWLLSCTDPRHTHVETSWRIYILSTRVLRSLPNLSEVGHLNGRVLLLREERRRL